VQASLGALTVDANQMDSIFVHVGTGTRYIYTGTVVDGRPTMAIYRLLQNHPMGPDEIKVLAEAYERTLRKLHLVDRNDPITEMVAKKIVEMGQRGVRDPQQLAELAIKELRVQ
jgi:hypothetical protein